MSEQGPVALLRADQFRRWRQGERAPVETFLEAHPALLEDPEAVLDLILNEVVLREQDGESPRLDEYRARFPRLEEDLRLLFEVHQALEPEPGSEPGPAAFPEETAPAQVTATVTAPAPARPASKAAPAAGITVPGYEIEAELGRGGMGVVYRARQLGLKRPVALKMVLAGAHAGPGDRARFRTEAEAVARLQHPHVVRIYEVGEHDGCPYLCLEYLDGGSLERRLEGTPQPARAAARLAETLARAVQDVHRHGILHRDLKPANVLLSAEGVPKIADFGLAKLLDSASGQTPSEAFLGTPSYMAPEQAMGRPAAVAAASDIYALGAILYELLTGRPPFRAATPLDTMLQVITADPVPPARLQPKVPRDLETICLKCLEKAPPRRYPDAGALADDLARFLAGEPVRARPGHAGQWLLKWARRRPAAAALLGVSSAALLGLAALAFWLDATGRQRLAEKRDEGRQAVFRAEAALASGDWPGAKVHLSRAQAWIGREPALAAEAARAGRLLAAVDRELAARAARQRARDRRAAFDRGRDEVLFRATQALDADSAALREGAVQAARAAFAAVGLPLELEGGGPAGPGPAPALDPAFEPADRAAIASGGAEMLLVLADALARPLPRPRPDPSPEDGRVRALAALRLLDRAAALRPPAAADHRRRARFLAILGDEAGARRAADAASTAAAAPATGAVDAFLAGVDLFMGGEGPGGPGRAGLAAAAQSFEAVLGGQADHFWARYYRAVCALNAGRPDLAEVYLTACLAQRPDFVWIRLLRGFARGELHAFEAAEDDFRAAEALALDADARYALLVNRSALRLAQGRLEEAAAGLEEARALQPGRYRADANLALLRKRQGRFAEAAERLERALRLGPPPLVRAVLEAERADLLLLTGRPGEALQTADALLEADPGALEPLGVRARALLERRDFAAAAAAFTRLLERSGAATAARADLFRGRGQARMKLGDYPGAVDDYTRALEGAPGGALRTHRGWAYFFAEAPRLALHDFEAALRLDPSGVDALIGRGLARVALGEDRAAVADAEEALRRPPADAAMRHNIACIFGRAAGREDPAGHSRDQAVAALRLALDGLPAAGRRPYWRDQVLTDPYLAPIRRSAAFLELGRQVEGAGGPPAAAP